MLACDESDDSAGPWRRDSMAATGRPGLAEATGLQVGCAGGFLVSRRGGYKAPQIGCKVAYTARQCGSQVTPPPAPPPRARLCRVAGTYASVPMGEPLLLRRRGLQLRPAQLRALPLSLALSLSLPLPLAPSRTHTHTFSLSEGSRESAALVCASARVSQRAASLHGGSVRCSTGPPPHQNGPLKKRSG